MILSTSDRCFPTKVVRVWSSTNDLEHVLIYGSYMHYAGAFEPPEAFDLTADANFPLARACRSALPYAAGALACGIVDVAGGRGIALSVGHGPQKFLEGRGWLPAIGGAGWPLWVYVPTNLVCCVTDPRFRSSSPK